MITLVGVGHVFDLGARIRQTIHARSPRVVCLELDATRLRALHQGSQGGRGPLTYRLLAHFQRAMAEDFGAPVGGEMLAAEAAAREVGASVALIDLDAAYIWRRLWSTMHLTEKARIFAGALVGFVAGRGKVEEELARYEEDSGAYLDEFGRRFPSVQKVLLDERNDHMARTIGRLHQAWGSVVAVVGDGHIPGLQARLAGQPVEVVRLKALRQQPPGDTYSVGFAVRPPGNP